MKKNSKLIAIKQAIAFTIDLFLVSLPLMIAPSLEILPYFAFVWYVYIPTSEYYFSQTIGMKIVGTKILNAQDGQSKIDLGTAFRRQIARIGMMWGVLGWLFLFIGKQYITDYYIVDDSYSSIDTNEDGSPIVLSSDLNAYGIVLMGHQITDWDFEKKTLDQISTKRQATMAIITAKANAERAKQDAITAEEQGKANVMKAKYEQEVLKEKAVVVAEREKEVATIKAVQLVDVATQQKLEAEQKKFAAAEYKQEQILRGEGDGEYKRLVMEADGALQQKLETYQNVSAMYADAIAKQKWVPEIQMGSNGGNGSAANDLISLLTTKAAKDLSLNMDIQK